MLAAWVHQPDDNATSSGGEADSLPRQGFVEKGLHSQRGCPERSFQPELRRSRQGSPAPRGKPAVAFAYFKDTETIGFRHDLVAYAEIILVLSHKARGWMLFSLFGEILSSADGGGGGP
ncbi:hypothetical protein ZWY2020_000351 [Hordeum vulgare]|nr:hypothetical protein ZWY2020_000351 [Hordeum vulgare]